ncbi:hypothetical protein ASZ90_009680 [hydrocarbon metagenome]|uniref:Uncharacterized protein n=1 Tax=hydrocarbon metagenome TaxID=938273 RepID=A0A0W8FI60_9ZZZZ
MGRPFAIMREAVRFPATVPAFARMISAVSGFFFCGMMELEEQ